MKPSCLQLAWLCVVVVALASCSPDESLTPPPLEIRPIPAHLPDVPVPADNPITKAKVELGRMLFYDARLSRDGSVACASCHRPDVGFSDAGRTVSAGVGGALGSRNSPAIINVAYQRHFFWDGRAASLEDQAMAAFLSPAEMSADTIAVAQLLRTIYPQYWRSAFGDTVVTMRRAMQAIATFERTLISAKSPYDRFITGDSTALTTSQRRGMMLFFSDRTMCGHCHSGPNFTDDQFHNVGLFNHYLDRGRWMVTRNLRDEAKFKTPSLRNVELTAPYMATGDSDDGPMQTLEDVVEHYSEGVRPFPTKDPRVKRLRLTEQEKADLVSFMKALTDPTVATNPAFQKPQLP